jgi:hypothetical protein
LEFAAAVDQVLSGREVTDTEREMLADKARSIVFQGLEDGTT